MDIQKYESLIANIKSNLSKKLDTENIEQTINYIREMTKNYSKVLGYSESDILEAIERERKHCSHKYYTSSKFPILDKSVKIFDTTKELIEATKDNKFICPCCKQVQSNAYNCVSGHIVNGKECDLRAHGLLSNTSDKNFKTYRKFRFTIKDTFLDSPMIDDCFIPVKFVNTAYDM